MELDGSGAGDPGMDATTDGNITSNVNSSTSTESWPYWFDTGCAEWLPVNHVYFQLANTFLFLSYLAPAGIYGLLYLRLMLAIGCGFFAIWGWLILCAFDTFIWYVPTHQLARDLNCKANEDFCFSGTPSLPLST